MTSIQIIESIRYGNVISIDTASAQNSVIVILSTTATPSKYIIQDIGGSPNFFSSNATYLFTINTAPGTRFLDGTTSRLITTPYGRITCAQVTPTLWEIIGSQTITDTSQPSLSTLNVNGNATVLSTIYTSTVTTKSIRCYGTVNASSITTQGILYATVSTISSAINLLEITSPYNYISISTMSTVISTASNAPYSYITSSIVAETSLLLSTTMYNYITPLALTNALGVLSTYPACLSSVSYAYLAGCTQNNYVYYTDSSLSTTSCVADITNGIQVTMSNDPGGVTANAWYTNVFTTNQLYGNAAGIAGIPSDVNLKRDIRTLVSSLELLNSLQGVSYKMKGSEKECIGFIAQNVEEVFPEVIREDNNLKGIRYSELIAPLVESIKDLDERIHQIETAVCGNSYGK